MTNLKFFRSKKSNGKTMFALLDDFHFPGVERTLFIHSIKSGSDASNEARVYALSHFLKLMSLMNVDVERLVSCGQLPSLWQINLYISASKLRAVDAGHYVVSRSNSQGSVRPLDFSEKQLHQVMYSGSSKSLKPIGSEAFNRRIDIAYQYLQFVFKYHVKKPTIEQQYNLEDILNKLRNSKRRRSKAHAHASVLKQPLTDNQFDQLVEIIKPDNPNNPFQKSKLRNFLIIWVIIATGLRRSGVAKIKIGDFDFSGDCNKLYMKRTPNDPSDSRKRSAAHKTREHIAVLPPELMLDIKKHYDNSRLRFEAAGEHEFVFVAEKSGRNHSAGVPLSLNSYNKIFEKLTEVLGFHIHPHRLRHHWNKDLDDIAKANNLNADEKEKMRKEGMGWSRNSQMGQLYARLETVKRMGEVNLQHQKEMYDAKK
ncbi:site-specific integrase [Vibrio splendidus]|uniref:site-specific integrase n=1 Tax=Vibrio splendidus TaxID=29497 RepID=UPI000C856E27|nr:site-specific integrase [Vibrio splendidus]PMO14796.1 hypothetical protein BCT15_04875 [Vibrio splendidus]